MSLELQVALYGVLIPSVLAAVALAAARRPWSQPPAHLRAWAPPLALGLGALVGLVAMVGTPPLPKLTISVSHWATYAVALAALLGALEAVLAQRHAQASNTLPPRAPVPLSLAIRLVLCVGVPALVLSPKFAHWDAAHSVLTLGLLACGGAIAWTACEGLAARGPTALPLGAVAWLALAAAAFIQARSATLGLACFGLASGSGALALLGLKDSKLPTRHMIPVLVAGVLALTTNAVVYAKLPPQAAALLLFAPAVAWTLGAALESQHRALSEAASTLGLGGACALAVGVTLTCNNDSLDPSDYDPGAPSPEYTLEDVQDAPYEPTTLNPQAYSPYDDAPPADADPYADDPYADLYREATTAPVDSK